MLYNFFVRARSYLKLLTMALHRDKLVMITHAIIAFLYVDNAHITPCVIKLFVGICDIQIKWKCHTVPSPVNSNMTWLAKFFNTGGSGLRCHTEGGLGGHGAIERRKIRGWITSGKLRDWITSGKLRDGGCRNRGVGGINVDIGGGGGG